MAYKISAEMISTRQDLKTYLVADAKNFQVQAGSLAKKWKWNFFSEPVSDNEYIWKYILVLRHLEYYTNNSIRWGMVFYGKRLKSLAYKTGFQIPPNVCGPGLTIYHYGTIIINDKAKIGSNVILYPGVLIGHKVLGEPAPVIGNNVFIGAGAKIIGDVHIGNNVTIAPNAIVVKDVPDNAVVGGVPAHILK